MTIYSPPSLKKTLSVVVILIASSVTHHSVFAQSPTGAPSTPAKAGADAAPKPRAAAVWTCPMHPLIRAGESGNCPICGMELTATAAEAPKLVSLQEMLAIALEHNPDVRAAKAKVRSVEAELDRTRLDVVQKLIAFRERWQDQHSAVQAAEQEAMESARYEKLAQQEETEAERVQMLLAAANEKLALQRAKLAEVEAELPFLLGRAPGRATPEPGDAARKLIREELLPKARQILELKVREYRAGNTSVLDVATANRQLMELEGRLAESVNQKIAAVESQQQLLEHVLGITQQQYQAGNVAQGDVLSIELELSKLKLQLLELKGK